MFIVVSTCAGRVAWRMTKRCLNGTTALSYSTTTSIEKLMEISVRHAPARKEGRDPPGEKEQQREGEFSRPEDSPQSRRDGRPHNSMGTDGALSFLLSLDGPAASLTKVNKKARTLTTFLTSLSTTITVTHAYIISWWARYFGISFAIRRGEGQLPLRKIPHSSST